MTPIFDERYCRRIFAHLTPDRCRSRQRDFPGLCRGCGYEESKPTLEEEAALWLRRKRQQGGKR